MAGSMAEAIGAVYTDPEFEQNVRLVVERPEHAPVDPAVAAAWAGLDRRELDKLNRLIGAASKTNEIDAADAVQDAILTLLESDPKSFADNPALTLGRVYNYARKRLPRMQSESLAYRCLSLDMSNDPKSAADPEREGTATMGEMSPAVAYTRAGVDEDARLVPPPKPREKCNRMQLIGIVQRFRDDTGRAPSSKEFGKNGIPSYHHIKRLGFTGLNDLLLEAGVPIEVPDRTRRRWYATDAAEACFSFRRRCGVWPGGEDHKRLPAGTIPPYDTMIRFFGGASPLKVQLGVEAILGPIDTPTWKPDGSLTAFLRQQARMDEYPDDALRIDETA